MMAKETGKKYRHVIHFLQKKWMTNHVPLLLQTTSFPKPKSGKQHLLQIILVEQLRIMLFDKVQDRQGLQNLSAQEDVTLYFCRLLFEKTYVSGLITEPQCLVAHGNPWMMKNSKFFLA